MESRDVLLLDKAESDRVEHAEDGVRRLLDCGVNCVTRVTLNLELGKNVGDGDNSTLLQLIFGSFTLDTWKRLREGLAKGLTIGDGSGDLSRFLSAKWELVLCDFLLLQ